MVNTFITTFILLLSLLFESVFSSDPELTDDFFKPPGLNNIDASFFTSTKLRGGGKAVPPNVGLNPLFQQQLPSLQGLGVSIAVFEFPPNSATPPHYHPRGTEVFYVSNGTLVVGFVDSTGKFFNQTLFQGDVFVFPKAMLHFQFNPTPSTTANAFSAFSSSNPGAIFTPAAIFGSGIPHIVLQKAFNVSSSVISLLEAAN